MKKYSMLIVVVLLLFVFSAAHATIWYVHPDSTLNSIQAGLDSCSVGDTVLVAAGTYYENIDWPDIDGIDLISESGPGSTIIDGGGPIGGRVIAIMTGDSTTIINGFTLQNGYADEGGGIWCYSSPTITNNIITGNAATNVGGGIYCYFPPIIRDNAITGNTATFGGGIYCWHYPLTITGNTITENTGTYGAGICCDWFSSPVIDSCTISNNNGDGIYCSDSTNPVIHYNNITGNTGYGIRNVDSAGASVDAENNWWGDASGPGGFGPGTGDSVSQWVDYDPWLTVPVGVYEQKPTPNIFANLQISPNPFCDRTYIKFQIPSTKSQTNSKYQTTLKIYNSVGQLIKSIKLPTSDFSLPASIVWDGRNSSGEKLPSGVYFVKYKAGDYKEIRKLLLLK